MKPERWQQIDKLLEAALEREESERSAFLKQACAGDESLQEEVESLLAADKQAEDLIEAPAVEMIAEGFAKDQSGSLKGRRMGSYKILSLLGAGGMGEVYRARDMKLEREVAIKVLPAQFTQDPERIARFQREAKLLASLNHPNIAAIHGLEESDGLQFLVLELVEGKTLAERVVKGPMPIEETLEVCRQIAEGVEAAHEKGVIHRDLKPANVKVTPEGKVKILDFGLAKAFEGETPITDISQSPTLTDEMTREGVILGTVAYVSPEQAKGKPVDKRADVFAFGAVLYELLTGKRAFEGETITETIAAVLKSEPDWNELPVNTPWRIQDLLHRCLTKDPHDRLRDIANVRIEIKIALTEPATAPPIGVTRASQPPLWKKAIPWSIAALVVVIATIMLWNPSSTAPTTSTSMPQPVVRFVAALPADLRVAAIGWGIVALSRDGSHLAYVATRGDTALLYLRSMDQLEAKPIPETENATHPFFSPDGQWLGFFADSKLKKVSVSGGTPVVLCDVYSSTVDADWSSDDTIAIANAGAAIVQVPAAGGTPQALTKLDLDHGETDHTSPQFLPDGNTLLFTVMSTEGFKIVVESLETGERKVVLEGAFSARYVPTGHLVYAQGGTLMAVAFDLEQLEITGTATSILENVMQVVDPVSKAHLAFSDTGTLVYIPTRVGLQERTLVWVDRQGKAEPLAAPPRRYRQPRLSPDGQRVIAQLRVGVRADLWIYDIRRDTLSRFTFENGQFPLWTPDGKRITFQSFQSGRSGGPSKMFWKAADGTGTAEQLLEGELPHTAHSWSPDGKVLAFSERSPASNVDIWILPLEGDRKPQVFLETPSNETGPVFSPDGRWLAYWSNESGRQEIYVQPFPSTGAKWQISTEGGEEAAWARSGELFYRNGDKMMAVDITTDPTFTAGTPKLLFEGVYFSYGPRAEYDVTPDGQKFLMIKTGEEQVTELNVIQNWFEELRRLVPTN